MQNSVANGQRLMSREGHESRRIAPPLAHWVGEEASAAQIAEAMVATWQEVGTALAPIIGQRGVAALYKRSLYLTGTAHPWLAGLHDSVQSPIDLAALKSVLAQQTSADAAVGGNALLQSFYQLLASLVGPSLTERLLRSVWADSFSGPPAQDTLP
jgi:hypothetical protein